MMSCWNKAANAPRNAVTLPITAMRFKIVSSRNGKPRTNKNTPAATIVAAWINADTGVGPAMAGGSQIDSGNCADFAAAPQKSPKPMAVIQRVFSGKTALLSRNTMSVVPNCRYTRITASSNPASPIRLIMNALREAR